MSGKYQTNVECPSCGALLQLRHFMLYCPFCGHVEATEGLDDIGQIDNDSVSLCYDYLVHNELFIRRNDIVHLDTSGKTYRILSKRPFSPNNGRWEKMNDLSINLVYTNDSNEDHLLFSVTPLTLRNMLTPYFAVLLNDNYLIQARLIDSVESTYYFEITIVEFTLICMSSEVDVSTNLIDSPAASFKEFKTFCCRFYNQVFDRTKYSYSLHSRLITDNY